MNKQQEVLLNIIELYKDMPFLWDKRNKDYTNKYVRDDGNRTLLEIYKEYDINATMKTLRKKIQNLRTGYFKEIRKIKKLNRAGSDLVYQPTLWYFDAMRFLGSAGEGCPSQDDTMKTEDNSTSSSDMESVRISEPSSTPPLKKRKVLKPSSLQKQTSLLSTPVKIIRAKEEEWETIGKGIGVQLRDLDKRQFYIAQKVIHDALYYAQMGLLTEHSSVTGLLHTEYEYLEDI